MARRRLLVDWPACTANGACAQAVPALVRLDEWGYPIVAVGPVPAALTPDAELAVATCPVDALRLVDVPLPASSRRERRLAEQAERPEGGG